MMTGPAGSNESLSVDAALAWLAEIFEEAPPNVRENTRRVDLPAWDSLGQLVLMSALDQRFGIRLTQSELSSLVSIGDILEILFRHGRLRRD
jgi:acyl carrier protein